MGEDIHNYQAQLDHLLTLDGDKLLDIIEKYGGSVIVNENQIINQRTSEVDEKCLTQLERGDYQAVIVDDTYFIREPKVTQFVMNQYEKGSSVVVISIEGIYNLSVLNRKFNVDWNVCAYTSRDIKLTDRGKDIIGDAFPRNNHYIKVSIRLNVKRNAMEALKPSPEGKANRHQVLPNQTSTRNPRMIHHWL